MITFSTRRLLALAAPALVLVTLGCASDKPAMTGDNTLPDEFEWWQEPGEIRDALVAVGSSKVIGNVTAARNAAEADGRAKIAQTVQAKVQSLVSTWFKEAGDNLDEATLSSYINNEGLVRQVTNVDIVGARPMRYKVVDGYQYVLMVVEDPAKWTQFLGKSVKDQVLKDATLFKTEVMKQDFEKKLDALIEQDAKAQAELTKSIMGQAG